jgi:enoyl-CoA hydratase
VACDLRVVAPTAKIGIPAAKLGVLLSAPNIRRLAVLMGLGAARDLLLTGRTITIDEARENGFAQRVSDDALATALEVAADIAKLAPLSVQGHKHALNIVAGAAALDAARVAEIRALEEAAFASADLQEGLAAFGDKRPPNFQGR